VKTALIFYAILTRTREFNQFRALQLPMMVPALSVTAREGWFRQFPGHMTPLHPIPS
jgi:hypothetical protein